MLSVRFNNATIAQIPLRRDQPSFDYPVEIPAELWRSGFNSVEFSVAQHSVESCEDPGSPDLWTELDLFKSTLSVNIQRRYPEDISGLSAIFNPGIGSQESILILTPATLEATSPSFRDALPGVAQALALRRQYRPLAIRERALASRAPASAFAVDGEGIPRRSAPVDPRSVAHYLGADDDTFHVIVGARDALREALARRRQAGPRRPVRLKTVKGDGVHEGVDPDDNASLLDLMES